MSDRANKGGAPEGNRNAAKPDTLRPVTVRLSPAQIARIKEVAAAGGITYNKLIRQWIDTLKDP